MKSILIAAGLVTVAGAAAAAIPLGRGEVTPEVTATACFMLSFAAKSCSNLATNLPP